MTESKDETIAFGDIRFTADQNEFGGRAYKDRGAFGYLATLIPVLGQ